MPHGFLHSTDSVSVERSEPFAKCGLFWPFEYSSAERTKIKLLLTCVLASLNCTLGTVQNHLREPQLGHHTDQLACGHACGGIVLINWWRRVQLLVETAFSGQVVLGWARSACQHFSLLMLQAPVWVPALPAFRDGLWPKCTRILSYPKLLSVSALKL